MTVSIRDVARAGKRRSEPWLRPVRRRLRCPFREAGRQPLLLHCAHHKAGTVWFLLVLRAVAERYGLRFQDLRGDPVADGTGVAFQHDSRIRLDGLGAVRASHMIRDPRDIVVSAYHYHRWTDEEWAHVPRPEYGGLGYQEYLAGLDHEAGLAAEIRLRAPRIREMAAWDYTDPRVLELRYEDAMADERGTFRALFRHYGFHHDAVERSVRLAARFSFRRVARKRPDRTGRGTHLRSGRSGQWQEEFTPAHKELFKELTGAAVVDLGYETDHGW